MPKTRLLASDAVRLSLRVPRLGLSTRAIRDDSDDSEGELVHLHLQPSKDLFHPEAKINYLSSEGKLISSEPLLAHHHKLYYGEVIASSHTERRFLEDKVGGLYYHPHSAAGRGVLGTATIHVYDDGLEGGEEGKSGRPSFAGGFQVDGRTWNVVTREHYLRHRKEGEPGVIVQGPDSDLVLFTEEGSDMPDESDEEEHQQHSSCAHDTLDFNTNVTTHPVLQKRDAAPWWIPESQEGRSLPSSFGFDLVSSPDVTNLFDPASLLSHPNRKTRSIKIKRDDVQTGGTASGQNFINSIGDSSGCPKDQRIVYAGFAADCNYVNTYEGAEKARTQILTNINT